MKREEEARKQKEEEQKRLEEAKKLKQMPTLPSRSDTNPLIPQKKNPLSGMPSIPKI